MTPEFKAAINAAMRMLGEDPRVLFVGQQMCYPGHVMYETMEGVPDDKRIEFPVAEELQTGFATGLALQGYIPVSCYPRMDFMVCAMNQLVNHLDKIEEMSLGRFRPIVILRTMQGSRAPLDPGPQHSQDHAGMFCLAFKHIATFHIHRAEDAVETYMLALRSPRPSLIIEAPEEVSL